MIMNDNFIYKNVILFNLDGIISLFTQKSPRARNIFKNKNIL